MSPPTETRFHPEPTRHGPSDSERSPLSHRRHAYGWWILGLCGLGLLGLAVFLAFMQRPPASPSSPPEGPSPPAQSVTAVPAWKGDMNVYLTGLGTVTALNTATLRSRVDGEIVKVTFVEGQTVRQGDLLIVVDPRPYQAQLDQAEGQLTRDQAFLDNARIDLKRDQEAKDAVSQQQLATQASLVAQYEGIVKTDQAQIASAKLNLVYCHIRAPFAGKIGLRLVDVGNLVHSSDTTGLAVVTQVHPITVIFTLPQDDIGPIVEKVRSGVPIAVEAWDRDLGRRLSSGTLLALDNQIDVSSGTVRIRAEHPNEDDVLYPNQFVMARLLLTTLKGTTLIPSAAVQQGPQGTIVYVVGPDQTVEPRTVQISHAEGALSSVERGLKPGEIVVTEGLDKVKRGTRVSVQGGISPAQAQVR